MPDPLNPFQIDGSDVDGMGLDSRHIIRPGKLAALREGRFPGSRSKFTIKGRAMFPTLIVTGWLREADFATLYTLIQQHQDAVGEIGSRTVTIQGVTFNGCDWVGFELTSNKITAYRDADTDPGPPLVPGLKVPVRFTFEIVTDPS